MCLHRYSAPPTCCSFPTTFVFYPFVPASLCTIYLLPIPAFLLLPTHLHSPQNCHPNSLLFLKASAKLLIALPELRSKRGVLSPCSSLPSLLPVPPQAIRPVFFFWWPGLPAFWSRSFQRVLLRPLLPICCQDFCAVLLDSSAPLIPLVPPVTSSLTLLPS